MHIADIAKLMHIVCQQMDLILLLLLLVVVVIVVVLIVVAVIFWVKLVSSQCL